MSSFSAMTDRFEFLVEAIAYLYETLGILGKLIY